MAHSHCTGPGGGTELGPGTGMMGLYIMPLTVTQYIGTRIGTRNGTVDQWVAYPFPHSQSHSHFQSRAV